MSLPPGSRIGAYEVVGPLGEGGMGVVLRGRDTRLTPAQTPFTVVVNWTSRLN